MSGWVMAGGSHEEGRQRGARWAIGEADGEELVLGRCGGGHEESGHSGGRWPAAR